MQHVSVILNSLVTIFKKKVIQQSYFPILETTIKKNIKEIPTTTFAAEFKLKNLINRFSVSPKKLYNSYMQKGLKSAKNFKTQHTFCDHYIVIVSTYVLCFISNTYIQINILN